MLEKTPASESVFLKRSFYSLFVLLFNTFTWYYMVLIVVHSVAYSIDMGYSFRAVYFVGVIASSVLGSILSDHMKRLSFLYFWIIFGAANSLLFIPFNEYTSPYFLVILFSLGFSFGLGMPSCLAYFSDYTSIENRGRASALIFSASNFVALPTALAITLFDVATNSVLIAIWRLFGFVAFASLKPQEKSFFRKNKRTSFSSLLQERSLVLYVVPWFMFNFIDRFEKFILKDFFHPDFYQFMLLLSPMIASFAILVGGILSDRIGRKRVVIYGFVSLGIAYALIGIAPMALVSWYLYLVIDGVAAGILWVLFLLILWGDLSQSGNREKYYVIGSIPFFLTDVVSLPLAGYIRSIPANSSFSLASFFLFLAVLPLMYAPETLPERKIRLRQLRSYAEAAKKVKEKYLKKAGRG